MAHVDKKKPALAMALDEVDDDTTAEDESESFDATASEMFDAIKSGDVEGFKTALRAAITSA